MQKTTGNDAIYTVILEGCDFEVDLPVVKLNLVKCMNAGNTARFQSVTDDDLQDFVVKQKNKSTVNKTFYDLKLLSSYLHRVNEMHEISEIPQNELYNLLCKFFVCVKKPDGSSYEPTTLRGFLGSFERYLRDQNFGYSLIHGPKFAKQKQLKCEGLGNKPKRADPITDEGISQLWETKQLGKASPESIINSLCFFNTVNFGLRGSDEHRTQASQYTFYGGLNNMFAGNILGGTFNINIQAVPSKASTSSSACCDTPFTPRTPQNHRRKR
ncbi:uncharacterized protein LOC128224401 [Mya arenaria]|uniref:uncharacterized protein LOC128224401 n=1 Tax=Mya arenaria TaxID=6604 RepID=UPI0022E1C11D|nr:uncharacterized protein LOC128224401 [Mya arenaria]